MSEGTIQELQRAIDAQDLAAVLTIVRGLPAEQLPEARKRVERLADPEHARSAVLAVDDRADNLGVALSA